MAAATAAKAVSSAATALTHSGPATSFSFLPIPRRRRRSSGTGRKRIESGSAGAGATLPANSRQTKQPQGRVAHRSGPLPTQLPHICRTARPGRPAGQNQNQDQSQTRDRRPAASISRAARGPRRHRQCRHTARPRRAPFMRVPPAQAHN